MAAKKKQIITVDVAVDVDILSKQIGKVLSEDITYAFDDECLFSDDEWRIMLRPLRDEIKAMMADKDSPVRKAALDKMLERLV